MTFAAMVLPAAVVAVLHAVRYLFLRVRDGNPWRPRTPHLAASFLVGGTSAAVIGATSNLQAPAFAAGLLLLGGAAIYEAFDYTSFRYFGTSFASNAAHLPFNLRSRNALKGATAYLRQYFPIAYLLAVLAVLIASAALARVAVLPSLPILIAAVILVGVGMVLLRHRPRASLDLLTPLERELAGGEVAVPVEPLRRVARTHAVRLVEPPAPPPRTILIVINESVGAHMPAAESRDGLLSHRIREIGGDPGAWFAPSNAVTNSSCTDISIPSILTGSAPYEGVAKLHAMPFVFDLAKARGYRTALFSSSTLGWAGFDTFFGGAAIDEIFAAENSGLPYVNDLTIDDAVPARELAARIAAADGPFLAVLYSNALHVPFQSESECGVPATITRRRDRATHIVQTVHDSLFSALCVSGRWDDALIFTLGDHGETLGNADDVVEQHMARTTDLHDCVARPRAVTALPSIGSQPHH